MKNTRRSVIMNSRLFFVQIKENLRLFLALAVNVSVGGRNDSFSLCHFIKRLNQSLPAASLAIENWLGILFWTANWTDSLLTSSRVHPKYFRSINPLNAELNPICYLLALLAHNFLHVSRIRVKSLTIRLLMSYIYIYMERLQLRSYLNKKVATPGLDNRD